MTKNLCQAHAKQTQCVVLPFPTRRSAPSAAPAERRAIGVHQRERLDLLRRLVEEGRLCSRADLSQIAADGLCACGVTYCARKNSIAFVREVAEASPRRLVFYRAGSDALSEDEQWLVRLLDAVAVGAADIAFGLVAFRFPAEHRRRVLRLALAASSEIDRLVSDDARATTSVNKPTTEQIV